MKYLIAVICLAWGASALAAFNADTTTAETAETVKAAIVSHSGRTDSAGCHHDHINGGYHCH